MTVNYLRLDQSSVRVVGPCPKCCAPVQKHASFFMRIERGRFGVSHIAYCFPCGSLLSRFWSVSA